MKNVDSLVSEAAGLAESGLSRGEIADELNVSRETASWLIERATPDAEQPNERPKSPQDIHIDWSTVGQNGRRLDHLGGILADVLLTDGDADLVVGIEKAGVPLATAVASELKVDLSTYTPRKHRWEKGDIDEYSGSFSHNFSSVDGADCYVVDDMITSGTTISETVRAVENEGGNVRGCAVIVDKNGTDRVDDVPVRSLITLVNLTAEE
ncbi:transcriptional regulator GfcR [Haloterrigena salifodinae]|uniref:transcriptional regulator GfcR n=1 Tax=Haloterrigena salifodinae TaxID=2675099 RepID=UPI000F866497|nr:transcriptional regulator GfcR [Haloterrigena salifodinae]